MGVDSYPPASRLPRKISGRCAVPCPMRQALAIGLVLVASTAAHAECRLEGRPQIVGAAVAAEAARTVDAHLGEPITAWLVAPGRLDGKPVLFSDAPGGKYVSWRG